MDELEGFILAGGASSRMGRDKSALRINGRSFIEIIAEALSHVAQSVSVVSSREASKAFGLPVCPDVFENCGALGGLHSALKNSRAPWIAVVSCDLPFVTGELFARLKTFALDDETQAVAPFQMDGRTQALCALYERVSCLEASERLLLEGERRPRAVLRQVKTRMVAFEELSDLSGSELFFRNINTPEDYESALRDGFLK